MIPSDEYKNALYGKNVSLTKYIVYVPTDSIPSIWFLDPVMQQYILANGEPPYPHDGPHL